MTRRFAQRHRLPCPILACVFREKNSRKGGNPQPPALPIRGVSVAFLAPFLLVAAACHSYHIDTTIENRTGEPIRLLEVDYPSASFGADQLAAGAVFRYRFQVTGSGPLKVEYTAANGRQVQITGPSMVERQQGQLDIVLLPGAKAEFHPQLAPPS